QRPSGRMERSAGRSPEKTQPAISMKIPTFKLFAYILLLPGMLLGAEEKGFVPIFNGKDLDGWDGKPGMWEVRNGEIWCTGKSKEKNWLIWRKEQPADFTLRLFFP
ncbi:uncharacterized protein METZ01_LOCUS379091, partial [marine metagenome]